MEEISPPGSVGRAALDPALHTPVKADNTAYTVNTANVKKSNSNNNNDHGDIGTVSKQTLFRILNCQHP